MHDDRQIGLTSLEDEVVMIAHEAEREQLRVEVAQSLSQDAKHHHTIDLISEDRCLLNAASRDVMKGVGECETWRAGMRPRLRAKDLRRHPRSGGLSVVRRG